MGITLRLSLDEMIGEYEMIKSEQEKKNSIKFQSQMLTAAISGLEFLNNKFDPFDLNLDGWSESVNEQISECKDNLMCKDYYYNYTNIYDNNCVIKNTSTCNCLIDPLLRVKTPSIIKIY